jgi:hypothetical protein
MQPEDNCWRAVSVELPRNSKVLGVDPEPITLAEVINQILGWIGVALRQLAKGEPVALWLKAVQDWDAPPPRPHLKPFADRVDVLLQTVGDLVRGHHTAAHLDLIASHGRDLQAALRPLGQDAPPKGPDWLGVLEMAVAITTGIAADHVAERGFDSINHLEFSSWLRRHGASERAVKCPLLTAGYHYAFAFDNGDWRRPNIAAGVAMRGLLRMVFGYHDSVLVHMRGGMGEVFVAPYYEVLRARGVRFHFFHRIEDIIPSEDGRVSEIRMRVQAEVRNGSSAYAPLIDYQAAGQPVRRCWPEAPLYEQLVDSEAVMAAGNLEKWIDSTGVGAPRTLRVDADFDLCVVAMSIGALRETTKALAMASPAWGAMLDAAGVTPTIGAQIWRHDAAASFHGVAKDRLMTGYDAPLDTWADMSFLIDLEQADADGARPASLSYFCGPITPADGEDRATRPTRVTDDWLQNEAAHIFPGLDDGHGVYRLEGELERCTHINDDPVDLYVGSPAGSIDNRLRPNRSGFANLMLAGDWTRNNFDCGAVETAVLSGKLCAKAITGGSHFIFGESDLA